MTDVQKNLEAVRDQIRHACEKAGRDPESVRLLAVSKFQPIEKIQAAAEAGQVDFGENYEQELRSKQEQLPELNWHFIGALQTNKIKKLAGTVNTIHSVDKVKQVLELEKQCLKLDASCSIMLEVNVGDEDSKRGCTPQDTDEIIKTVSGLERVKLIGLMSLPPFELDAEETRPYHAALRKLRDALQDRHGIALPELSMGMSHDLEPAIEEGSTWVRVGTAIFGERPSR